MKHKYKFDYGNPLKFTLSKFASFLLNITTLAISGLLAFMLIMAFGFVFKGWVIVSNVFACFIIILEAIFAIYLIIIFFFEKMAIIKNDYLYIKRYTFDLDYPVRGFNDRIYILDILECTYYKGKTYSSVHKPYAVIFFNWDNLVKIRAKNPKGKIKEYYVPIKDADEFIAEINAKIEKIKFFSDLNIDKWMITKDGKKLSYDDLKVRWKGKDEIDSIYYVDENGNKIDLVKY